MRNTKHDHFPFARTVLLAKGISLITRRPFILFFSSSPSQLQSHFPFGRTILLAKGISLITRRLFVLFFQALLLRCCLLHQTHPYHALFRTLSIIFSFKRWAERSLHYNWYTCFALCRNSKSSSNSVDFKTNNLSEYLKLLKQK